MTMRFEAEPYPLTAEPASTALLVIDMQRDFVEPGGFGEMLGNDVSLLRSAIEPCSRVLEAARDHGMRLRVHAEELGPSGGARLAAELGAATADHLVHVTDATIAAFAAPYPGGFRKAVPSYR